MRTAWVVQTNVEPESTSPALLRRACDELQLPFHGVTVTRDQPHLPDFPNSGGPAVFHGRNTLIQRALEHPHWQKGVFFAPENFQHAACVAGYGSAMLNADARVTSLDELLSRDHPPSAELFVRPVDDSKRFTGRALRIADLAAFQQSQSLPGELALVVAEVREVDAEWRLFLVDGRVAGGSMYRPTADHVLSAELIQFAERAAQQWMPAPVFVMDVARIDRAWKIVECNCFNGSRFYDADVVAIIDAVSVFQSARW